MTVLYVCLSAKITIDNDMGLKDRLAKKLPSFKKKNIVKISQNLQPWVWGWGW